jgi:hypothetical protein
MVARICSRLFFLPVRTCFAAAAALFLLPGRSSPETGRLLAPVPVPRHRDYPSHFLSYSIRALVPYSAEVPPTAVVAALDADDGCGSRVVLWFGP